VGVDARETRSLAGRYRLVERLGVGGMSVVWRGYDEVLGRQVAVKVLAPTLASEKAFRHRLRAEAQAAARLCHPHITSVYDYGEATGSAGTTIPYVVMELIDGESMSARLRRGALPWREAVTACAEVASALAVAHARGLVHRDVTPSNVMLTDSGAKMVDFGISAVVGENDVGADGALLGTPAYLAPERMDAGVVSPATDVYALGVLLHRSLAGRLPWHASTTTELLKAHRGAAPEPLPRIAGLPTAVAELCRRCLAKRPEDRPGTAEVARALATAVGIVVCLPGQARVRPGAAATGPSAEPGHGIGGGIGELGTTILPSSAPAAALPPARPVHPIHPARPTRTGRPAGTGRFAASTRRRAEAVLVGAGLVAVAGLIWAGVAQGPPDKPGGELAAGQSMALGPGSESPTCKVEYQLDRDTGRSFDATVTVTNTGRQPVDDGRLEFAFPGDQRVDRGSGGDWRQSGREVVVRPSDARLASGKPVRLAVTGAYREANPLPVIFTLNGTVCAAVVSGTSGGTAAGEAIVGTAAESTSRGGPGGDAAGAGKGSNSGKGSDSGSSGGSDNSGKGKGKGKKDG
jgi:serine/threonine-protein kinase